MREQHPVDDLFARALRDAEADPAATVWEGVVRERNWAHLTLLRLRRRWGWLALLLFLGGATGYAALFRGSPSGEAPLQGMSLGESPIDLSGHGEGSRFASLLTGDGPAGNSEVPLATNSTGEATDRPGGSSAHEGHDAPDPVRGTSPSGPERERAASEQVQARATPGMDGAARPHPPVRAEQHREEARTPFTMDRADAPGPEAVAATSGGARARSREAGHGADRSGQLPWLQARSSLAAREGSASSPKTAPSPPYAGPRHAWWAAATMGQFREARTWRNGDGNLVEALQGTEQPHPVTALGLLVGSERRGGWNFAIGLEYAAARYDFSHLDRFRSRRDSIISYVVTFNAQVVDSYSDTVTTYREAHKPVAAVNRYSTLRVPLEAGWHTAHRRFHIGMRGGIAVEFNTMLSGVTLTSTDEETRSVDASTVQKCSATLLSAHVAADLGYALTERWGLWASPMYSAGLFSLSSTENIPYAVPERLGIRFRLAYTLRPGR